jgi:hypothetical protein
MMPGKTLFALTIGLCISLWVVSDRFTPVTAGAFAQQSVPEPEPPVVEGYRLTGFTQAEADAIAARIPPRPPAEPLFVDLSRCPTNRPGMVAIVTPTGYGFWVPVDHPDVVKYNIDSPANPLLETVNGFPNGCRENPLMLRDFTVWMGLDDFSSYLKADERFYFGGYKSGGVLLIGEEGYTQRQAARMGDSYNTKKNNANLPGQTGMSCFSFNNLEACVELGSDSSCPMGNVCKTIIDNDHFLPNDKHAFFRSTATRADGRTQEWYASVIDVGGRLQWDISMVLEDGIFATYVFLGNMPITELHGYVQNMVEKMEAAREPSLDRPEVICWLRVAPAYDPERCLNAQIFSYRRWSLK